MKYLAFLLSFISFNVMSNDMYEQKVTFNDYSGSLKISSVNRSLVTFSGSQEAKGEVVFIVSTVDDYPGEIDKTFFVPDEPSLFPYITSGFYPKSLIKINLYDHFKLKELLFTDSEWEHAISKGFPIIIKQVKVEIHNYATTIECDSRNYYAEILAIKSNTDLVKSSEKHTDSVGCH